MVGSEIYKMSLEDKDQKKFYKNRAILFRKLGEEKKCGNPFPAVL